ncbi:ParB/RepB/Spo0J family partition protein [Azospirillum sp. SYSU D00513]|uniref:ParB/RepB/Spo0J family partition protein n=1 Tax=Azospirillum sp. SYSU D00513 TaxID=2812561 RepID=UPI001A96E3E6|nr:ParB/RepB/Spo0J family partition protein [Azospirillum sp. SYSU D00513]
MHKAVAIKNLRRSASNVRTTDPHSDVESLAADILAHGLLQNLIVRPSEGKGMFEVTGGGRRLAALQLLAARGDITEDHEVPCLIRKDVEADATEVSLSENLARVAMHPADAYEAFAKLIDQGKTVEEVALRFGLPQRTVRQRLKLGKLSPVLMGHFRRGDLDQEDCEAFAMSDDHALQEQVYETLARHRYNLTPHMIRHTLTEGKLAASSKLGRFVRNEYIAKGLPVTTDLFAEDGTYLDDRAAAVEVATAKLDAACAQLVQEGWAWAKPLLEYDYSVFGAYKRVQADENPTLSQEDEDQRLALVVAHNTILSQYRPDLTIGRPGGAPAPQPSSEADSDDLDDTSLEAECACCGNPIADDCDFHPFCSEECAEEGEAEPFDGEEDGEDGEGDSQTVSSTKVDIPEADAQRMAELKRLIAEIDEKTTPRFSAAIKAKSGAFVLISHDGDFDFRLGYMVPGASTEEGSPVLTPDSMPQQTAANTDKAQKGPYSAALASDLAAHRTQAFQIALAQHPAYAKSYLLFTLWERFGRLGYVVSSSSLTGEVAQPTNTVTDMATTLAAKAMQAIKASFQAKLNPSDGDPVHNLEVFKAIHGLSDTEKDALLAYLMASTVTCGLSEHGGRVDPITEHIGQQIGADPAKWWRPTGTEFFARVSKGYLASEVTVLGRGVQALAAQKKGVIAEKLDRWFADPSAMKLSDLGPVDAAADGPISVQMVEQIGNWLPVGMAWTQNAGENTDGEAQDEAQADAA